MSQPEPSSQRKKSSSDAARGAAFSFPPLYLNRDSAAWYLSISVAQLENMAARGEVPPPRQLSKGRVGWLVHDLNEWGMSRPVSNSLPPHNAGYGRAGKPASPSK